MTHAQGPRVWALTTLLCLAGPPCLAQDPHPKPEKKGADDELEKLRKGADDELDDDGDEKKDLSDEGALKQAADEEAGDEGPLYQQLLNAFSSVANRLNAFNPRITVFGDVLGRWSVGSHELVEDGINRDDRIGLREIELDLRADIDPYAKGVLVLAAEEHEPGEYELTIEEGYVTLEALPAGLRGTIGRIRVPYGRINRLHTHDLPQATRPLMLVDFFGEEGYVENAAQISWLTPWIPLEVFALILNGENEGILAGRDSDDPAFLGRAEYFLQLNETMFLSLGTTFLFGHNDAPDPLTDRPGKAQQETQSWGGDFLFKWQPSQYTSLVVQGEMMFLKKEVANRGVEHGFGGYVFVQFQPFKRWYVGVRYDWSNYGEGTENNEQYAASAWLSYYTTEFLRFRIGYEHRERATTNGGEPDLDTIFFQLTFVFGSHPAEPFWFNK